MKVIFKHEAFNFDDVASIHYRASVVGDGYPIGIMKNTGRFFNNETVIARVASEKCAQQLVRAITEAWAANTSVFDIDDWLEKNPFPPEEKPEPRPRSRKHQKRLDDLYNSIARLEEIRDKLNDELNELKGERHEND